MSLIERLVHVLSDSEEIKCDLRTERRIIEDKRLKNDTAQLSLSQCIIYWIQCFTDVSLSGEMSRLTGGL